MAQTVKVRLRKPTQVSEFLSKDIPVGPGDGCIVRSERGLEYGICAMPPEDVPPEQEKKYTMSVVRKATHNDETTFRQILIDEKRAKELCEGKIEQRNLPMRLVDVQYTFDRHKVVFYFTADERVDFRELVRDLAHELKTRIELRHIQVRDKAKMVGGIGSCGRELCCATWMGDFMPISMKMAKRQNLSLNPSKISGQCGRLMCCLSYENHNYSDKKKKKNAAAQKPEPTKTEDAVDVDDENAAATEPCAANCAGCPAALSNQDTVENDLQGEVSEWDDSVEDAANKALLAEEDGASAEEDSASAGEDGASAEEEGVSYEEEGAAKAENAHKPAPAVAAGKPSAGDLRQQERNSRRKSRRRRKRRRKNRDSGGQNSSS